MSTFNRCRALALGLGLMLQPTIASAHAEEWPQHTVRVIVPLPAGTSVDVAARLVAQRLAQRWGQPVIVENRPGADGILAVKEFLAIRDNHALLFSFAGVKTINPLTHDRLPYDPDGDLVPIAPVEDNFFAIALSDKLNVVSVDDFVTLARAQPGKLNWAATSGLPDFIFQAFQKQAGLKLTQVPYREFAPALRDLDEGRVQVAVTGLSLLVPHVEAGRARLLMVTNRQRAHLAPETPTAREAGYPDLTFDGVVGFYGWRDMPIDLVEKIATDVRAVSNDPGIAARLESMGSVVRLGTPAEFAGAIEEQRAKIAAIARGMKPTQ